MKYITCYYYTFSKKTMRMLVFLIFISVSGHQPVSRPINAVIFRPYD